MGALVRYRSLSHSALQSWRMGRGALVLLFVSLLLQLSLCTSFFAQNGARTIPRTLDQLIEESDLIVHGYVISSKLEPHPQLHNLTTVVVSMSVKDTYKGKSRKTLLFRQYVWDASLRHDVSEYRKGQELILLLLPASEYGLTSPAGLEQGRFRILLDRKGRPTAVNGRGNFGLFDQVEEHAGTRGVQLSPHTKAVIRKRPSGPLLLADLEDAIRTFARTN